MLSHLLIINSHGRIRTVKWETHLGAKMSTKVLGYVPECWLKLWWTAKFQVNWTNLFLVSVYPVLMGYSSWPLKQLGSFLTDARKSNMNATLLYSQNASDINSLFLPSPPQTQKNLSFVISIWIGCIAHRWEQLSCTPKTILESSYVSQFHKSNYFSPAQHCNYSVSNTQC